MPIPSTPSEVAEVPERSRWRFLLPIVWLSLGARIVVALSRHESLRDDYLSIAVVAFFMTSAVLGSHVWLWLSEKWARLFPEKRMHDIRSRAHG